MNYLLSKARDQVISNKQKFIKPKDFADQSCMIDKDGVGWLFLPSLDSIIAEQKSQVNSSEIKKPPEGSILITGFRYDSFAPNYTEAVNRSDTGKSDLSVKPSSDYSSIQFGDNYPALGNVVRQSEINTQNFLVAVEKNKSEKLDLPVKYSQRAKKKMSPKKI